MRSHRLLIALTAAALAVPAATAAAADCPGADLQPDQANGAQVAAATICLVNEQRAAAGIGPLSMNDKLSATSAAYASEMVDRGFFAHTAPDGVGLVDRINHSGYVWVKAGENLAWGSGVLATPAKIVDAWMASEGHRRNILDAGFREVGFGLAIGAPADVHGLPAATYATDFGTPPAPAASSAPRASASAKPASKHAAKRHRARKHRARKHAHRKHAHHRHAQARHTRKAR